MHIKFLVVLGFVALSNTCLFARAQNIPFVEEPLLPQEELLRIFPDLPTPEQNLDNVTGRITIERFDFDGSNIFSNQRLRQEIQEFTNTKQPITFTQLLQAASKITSLYIKEGYVTSGAYIPEQTLTGCFVKSQGAESCVVKIQIIEGSLQELRVTREPTSSKQLNDSYVRSRLELGIAKPLNIIRLRETLQLLQQNPLIESISAELSAGTIPGTNLLKVTFREASTDNIGIILDNSRNPSVGSFRRGVEIEEANLTGLGDRLNIGYDNTDGSNGINASYTIPINSRNGTIGFSYSKTSNNIIEPPFKDLDIESNSRNYEISLRQPVVQNARAEFTQELALGLTLSRRESDTSVLGVDFPISVGADARGNTRISALRFFQEWRRSSFQEVFLARSQFSVGVGAFNASMNDSAPDSRFFAWRGQLQWLRLLGSKSNNPRVTPRLLVRSDVQLANTALVPLEQFTLGGIFSARGYRQDALFSDNGVFVSADLQLPIYSTAKGNNILRVIPFVDVGTTWNSGSESTLDTTNTLASVGLGLQWQMGEQFNARLDYGIPLVNIDARERTWQEKGFYFTLQYNPF
ncbi:surface antigen (D15) [Rivularia sp. IAM M-261]|nr:surface antigen (D15) [Calothrix sp. PCC 7716]GJD15488.1 surface antigen (D15) [Rivularia sp. IAM M-261]